jgi:prepilin-type processing-associated H-X9-DG protein
MVQKDGGYKDQATEDSFCSVYTNVVFTDGHAQNRFFCHKRTFNYNVCSVDFYIFNIWAFSSETLGHKPTPVYGVFTPSRPDLGNKPDNASATVEFEIFVKMNSDCLSYKTQQVPSRNCQIKTELMLTIAVKHVMTSARAAIIATNSIGM